ncbi:hypothetical protein QC761_0083200 [Podospora bellae-mahoneyi]|uniref:Uncharacterized protein n=1 Tax=Podospora bellae-mahoneyi TaxID=2093777 RepID=A0ABR0FGU5_9PEZI|nr:hypothetical protein QC761_0083200 [Podospora bellae-mahoneyi]
MSMTLSTSLALRVMRVEREFRWTANVYGIMRINVRYIWTPGHCGVAMKKLVDNLCTQARLSNKPLYVVKNGSQTFQANVRSYFGNVQPRLLAEKAALANRPVKSTARNATQVLAKHLKGARKRAKRLLHTQIHSKEGGIGGSTTGSDIGPEIGG